MENASFFDENRTIEDIFEKDIKRHIPSVIKPGPDNIYQELDEYVVTNELLKHFSEFFENYSKSIGQETDDMGVWITGFFGSGKSHFLKILSYILDSNLEVKVGDSDSESRRPIDFFKEDKKIEDPHVIANMGRATSVSTDVILFNIDSKASHDSLDNQKDDILNVFVKVFNEYRGFCVGSPYIAELEKRLVSQNVYEEFKEEFLKVNGGAWENEREGSIFIQDDIVESLVNIGFMSRDAANNWANRAEESMDLSIENFAKEIKDYCDSMGNDHHVVFLVDEVGQFIADQTKLMLNLQTLVEELGSKCKGKAWVVVTSQQNIDEVTKVKGNDFSKIQARFKTRLALSSSNVDEIIRKRILSKNKPSKESLKAEYPQIEADIKNKLTFEHSADMKKFSNDEDYANIYPFVPYQFDLMQLVLKYLREKGITGSGIGEGERSMLKIFQDSANVVINNPLDSLVPFDVFYNSIQSFLEHTYSSVINKAYQNEKLNDFDVRVLKVLFLIRHVKEIKSSKNNIASLMISNIHENRIALIEKISKSLDKLKEETLIQKNSDEYIFLTNIEQDTNKEIKREIVDDGEILDKAFDIIFLDIYPKNKYRYNNRYNFPFNKAIDDREKISKFPIGFRIITPKYEFNSFDTNQTRFGDSNKEVVLKGLSEKNEVIVQLHSNFELFEDIKEILQIEKYLRKNPNMDSAIKNNKIQDSKNQLNDIKLFLEDGIKYSKIYIKGDEINITDKGPEDKLEEAMGRLVSKVYNKLSHMEFAPNENDILKAIQEDPQSQLLPAESQCSNALNDVDLFIKRKLELHNVPSLKLVLDEFTDVPYGFVPSDVQWLVAKLFSQKRINFSLNSEDLSIKNTEPNVILNYLTKSEFSEKLVITGRTEVNEKKKRVAKDIMRDVFGHAISSDDSEDIMDEFKKLNSTKLDSVNELLRKYDLFKHEYPGKHILKNAQTLFEDINNKKNIKDFFDFVLEYSDDFNELNEDLDPIFFFFNSNQKSLFENGWDTFDIYEENKNLINNNQIKDCAEKIHSIVIQPNPYSNIKDLPFLIDEFENEFKDILEKERQIVKNGIILDWNEVKSNLENEDVRNHFFEKFHNDFLTLCEKLGSSKNISIILGISNESENLKEKCINEISNYGGIIDPSEIRVTLNLTSIFHSSNIHIDNEEDINKFLEAVKSKVKQELENNNKINLKL